VLRLPAVNAIQETAASIWAAAREQPDLLGQVGALVGGVLLVCAAARARGWSAALHASIVQDGAYLAARAFLTLPLGMALLAGLSHLVATVAPGIQTGWLPGLPSWQQFTLYVISMDGLAYAIHRAFHAVPWLWHFHAIHHSQPALNPFTTTRIHLVEVMTKRVLMWAPLAIVGEPVETLAWFVALDGFWGFFVHSGLKIPLGPLRYLIVEPGYHQLHHSRLPEHYNANFAERFVIWDLLSGTGRFEDASAAPTGVDDPSFPVETRPGWALAVKTWYAQFLYPFRRLGAAAREVAQEQ
jgi:sterol desaturase/sphingolipid hydroxylase (fatty acid hydroxylase superfamily)